MAGLLSAVLVAIVFGGVMLVWLLVCEIQILDSEIIPFSGSCNAVIAAACHPIQHDDMGYSKLFRWGKT